MFKAKCLSTAFYKQVALHPVQMMTHTSEEQRKSDMIQGTGTVKIQQIKKKNYQAFTIENVFSYIERKVAHSPV